MRKATWYELTLLGRDVKRSRKFKDCRVATLHLMKKAQERWPRLYIESLLEDTGAFMVHAFYGQDNESKWVKFGYVEK